MLMLLFLFTHYTVFLGTLLASVEPGEGLSYGHDPLVNNAKQQQQQFKSVPVDVEMLNMLKQFRTYSLVPNREGYVSCF